MDGHDAHEDRGGEHEVGDSGQRCKECGLSICVDAEVKNSQRDGAGQAHDDTNHGVELCMVGIEG